MFKIMDDDIVAPADPAFDIDTIVRWLVEHGYVERGAFIGENEELAVFWLKPGDEPEDLSGIVGAPIVPATVRYVPGEKRFASTRTVHEIQRSRRRNPSVQRDLAFIRLPTRAELARAYGV